MDCSRSIPIINLPTPPRSMLKEKENRPVAGGSRVVWSPSNQEHDHGSPPKHSASSNSSQRSKPKGILKKTNQHLMPPSPEDKPRDVTPEPADPLVNLTYLEYPVGKIVAPSSSLRELIEGYNVLAVRIRGCVNDSTDADASWPLFQPMRKNYGTLVECIIRDLGRALVDPEATSDDKPRVLLPSPQNTPTKKRGMSAEQVKYARDLCTTTHSVIKLLAVLFTVTPVQRLFQDKDLSAILTGLLAIPLADTLPTPNSRKTCALSIWLLQVQRLPEEVLFPAKDRIAYALRRGIDGELGREGKKGAACDGLVAVHDLSLYRPSIFVPAFADILPSILSNLLAPTLLLRTQACHALGGLVLGLTSLPRSPIHVRISRHVATYLMTSEKVQKRSVSTSPSKSQESAIVRTIRTTLNAVEPEHVAQGPIWALSVLASFVVLLGPALCTDTNLVRLVSALLSASVRHKKGPVRGVASLVWRCVTWVYFQPPFPSDPDSEPEVDEEDDAYSRSDAVRHAYWTFVRSVGTMGAGISTIAALMNARSERGRIESSQDGRMKQAIEMLESMIAKNPQLAIDALDCMKQLVSFETPEIEWTSQRLLPPSLFSAIPGLLTTDFQSIKHVLQPILDQTPSVEDIPSLTREEIAQEWVFEEFVRLWKDALTRVGLQSDTETQPAIISIWDGLMKARVGLLHDSCDDAEVSEFALQAARILSDILQDNNIDLTTNAQSPSSQPPASSPIARVQNALEKSSAVLSNGALKLRTVRDLWVATRTVIPHVQLAAAGSHLFECLVRHEEELTENSEVAKDIWAGLLAAVMAVCEPDTIRAFWGKTRDHEDGNVNCKWNWTVDVRRQVWRTFLRSWKDDGEGHWEGGVVLLAIPLQPPNIWELSGEDLNAWEEFLQHLLSKALDGGVDSLSVLESLSATIVQYHGPINASSTRVADLILTSVEISNARELPESVLSLLDWTLRESYSSDLKNTVTAMWLLRSLTHMVEQCPSELLVDLLDALKDGLALWIIDEYHLWSTQQLTDDILPFYEMALAGLTSLPPTLLNLEKVATLLASGFEGRLRDISSLTDTFTAFWKTTYATLPTPSTDWPQEIQICLQGTFMEDAQDEAEVETHLSPTSSDADEVETTSDSQTLQTSWFNDFSDVANEAELTTPTRQAPSTPTRPQKKTCSIPFPSPKHSSSWNSPSAVLRSPVSPLSARQRRVSAKSEHSDSHHRSPLHPSKRRRLSGEKENAHITEIILPLYARPLSLGRKRRADDDMDTSEDEVLRAMRRRKLSLDGKEEPITRSYPEVRDHNSVLSQIGRVFNRRSEDRVAVEELLVDNANKIPRNRTFMDAVEVPKLRDVLRKLKPSLSLKPTTQTNPAGPTLHRRGFSLDILRRKRTREDEAYECEEENDEEYVVIQGSGKSTDPFVIHDSTTLPAGRVTTRAARALLPRTSQEDIVPPSSSSDDDPHLGQVTPHHIISPEMRPRFGNKTAVAPPLLTRMAAEAASDPGSDDSVASSVGSSSPLRRVTARRNLQRPVLSLV